MIRIFSHYISKGMLLLVLMDALLLFVAVPAATYWRLGGQLGADLLAVIWFDTAIFTLLGLVAFGVLGLYRWDFEEGLGSLLFRLPAAFASLIAALALMFYLFPGIHIGRGVVVTACLFALISTLLLRLVFFRWVNLDILKHRVLVLGTGTRSAKIISLLRDPHAERRMHLVGFLPLQGVHHFVDHSLILEDTGTLTEIVEKYEIDEIVIAVRERRGGGLPVNELLECRLKGVRILELSTFFERERGQVQVESLNASWMVLSEGFHLGFLRDTVKRLFDLFVSLTILIVSLPVIVLAAIIIAAESGFPILYRQERVGQGGRVFTIYKFRSMVQDAEKDGKPQWAQAGDIRVTAFGNFIRKVRIDELPQLFNVFRGDMSFVGPRPERPYFVDQLIEQVPYYASRHSLKPGITGWAQVRYPYGASLEDAVEKLQYDLYYVKNHTLFLDLMILFQTLQVVIFGKGAR